MNLTALAGFLAWASDGEQVTITVRRDALLRALEMADGGPEIMSTVQAAQRYGWTAKRWRDWACAGRVVGAWRDEQGTWRLPKASCVELTKELQERGARPQRSTSVSDLVPRSPAANRGVAPSSPPTKRSIRRGARKSRAS